jgi:surface carbohydrate biosynthesis protein
MRELSVDDFRESSRSNQQRPRLMKKVLYFVDQKKRDLPGICLIAHLLKQRGVDCILEPVQAWRAAVALHKPGMIVISNLFADNLIQYSQRLRKMGVKICILPNEGVLYDEELRNFNAFFYHKNAAIDMYLAWNNCQAELIEKNLRGTNPDLRVHTVGCHRFDFNFPPLRPERITAKPTLLICTIFGYAHYYTKDKKEAEEWLAPFKDKFDSLSDWWGVIEANYNARSRFLLFAERVLADTDYDIIIKPHPNETVDFYERWIAELSENNQQRIRFARDNYLWEVLNECDLLISCETCTTSVEAWMVGKPTLEFIFERKAPFYFHQLSQWNLQCSEPDEVVPMINQVINCGVNQELRAGQVKHLEQWYSNPDGQVSKRIAEQMATLVASGETDYSSLNFSDKRRALKLWFNNLLGKQYGLSLLTRVKGNLMPKKYGNKLKVASRAVSGKEVKLWMDKVGTMLRDNSQGGCLKS